VIRRINYPRRSTPKSEKAGPRLSVFRDHNVLFRCPEICKCSNLQIIIIFGRTSGAQFHYILIFLTKVCRYLEERRGGKKSSLSFFSFEEGGPCANRDAVFLLVTRATANPHGLRKHGVA